MLFGQHHARLTQRIHTGHRLLFLVVDEEPGLLTVAFGEVVCRDLKRLVDPFADGDRFLLKGDTRPSPLEVRLPDLSRSLRHARFLLGGFWLIISLEAPFPA